MSFQDDHWTVVWQRRLRSLPHYFRIRPDTGIFWLDCIFLVAITAIQFILNDSWLGHAVTIELVVPWLTVHWVRLPIAPGLALAMLGAALLECHSTAPIGLYFAGFTSAALVINLARDSISWIYLMPWMTTTAVVLVFQMVLESLAIALGRTPTELGLSFWLIEAGRLLSAMIATFWIGHSRFDLRLNTIAPTRATDS